jgi:hypothetical protein
VSYISGYVNSKAKASATTVLTTEYQNPDGGSATVPIYSYWNYGNGKVSTFTSKMSGDWVRKWTSLGLDKDFFNNVISTNTPDQKNDYPFTVEMRTDSGICYVEVTPATLRADSLATISVTNADGEKIVGGNLTFDSSLYSYTFSAVDVGKYIVNITYSYGGSDYTCQTIFNVSYGAEYDSFTVYDSTVLHKMVGTYGNVSENGAFKIENDENEISTMTVKLTVPLLIACVVLFAVDIIIRKLKWKDVVSFFRLNKINKGK